MPCAKSQRHNRVELAVGEELVQDCNPSICTLTVNSRSAESQENSLPLIVPWIESYRQRGQCYWNNEGHRTANEWNVSVPVRRTGPNTYKVIMHKHRLSRQESIFLKEIILRKFFIISVLPSIWHSFIKQVLFSCTFISLFLVTCVDIVIFCMFQTLSEHQNIFENWFSVKVLFKIRNS